MSGGVGYFIFNLVIILIIIYITVYVCKYLSSHGHSTIAALFGILGGLTVLVDGAVSFGFYKAAESKSAATVGLTDLTS
jgi:hypothetical protein